MSTLAIVLKVYRKCDTTKCCIHYRALFPNGDSMVCIIDDREDVWNMASNLIQVKPYHFFQHTGDINAPPGLSKHELDGEGVDFKGMFLSNTVLNAKTNKSYPFR